MVAVLVMGLVATAGAPALSASAAAAITVSPSSGPPTSPVTLSGTGYGSSETVDLQFDGAPAGTASTNPAGSFTKRFRIPAFALPGSHVIKGTGETSGLSAQTDFLVTTAWPQFRFNPGRSGLNPFENVVGPGNVAQLAEKWSAPTGSIVYSSPAVANGTVYFGSYDDKIYAVQAASGATVWTVDTLSFVMSSPAVVNGVVYATSMSGTLYGLDASTGTPLWTAHPGPQFAGSSPTIVNGILSVCA